MRIIRATIVYVLPVPSAHYIDARLCEVTYAGCRSDSPCNGNCLPGNLSLPRVSNEWVSNDTDCGERPPYEAQGCPWKTRIDLLGQVLQTLLPGALNALEWPYPCLPGILGASFNDIQKQTTSLCAGFCPRGFYCPSKATLDPILCPPGHSCPEGSALPRVCPSGRYSNASGLWDSEQCSICPSGSSCGTGSTSPTSCAPGSVQPQSGQAECVACVGGSYRSGGNGTRCEPCKAGSYCPRGASAPLPCAAGTYSSKTNLTSADECTPTEPGFFAPTGSDKPSPCSPGTFSAQTALGICLKCKQGTFQPAENATSCEDCPRAKFCDSEGMATPRLCPAGQSIRRNWMLRTTLTFARLRFQARTAT